MASSSATGSATSLSESRAQALQALLHSLSPGAQAHDGGKLNPDQVRRISDKLGEILGEDAMPDADRRNEKGELVNEEGLPIVDIVEPVPANQDAEAPIPVPGSPFGDTSALPLWTLSPAEKARRRAERDRILDMLEEEEQIEQEKEEAEERERFQAELEKRKEAAKAEMDAVKTAREMHKKMGKALLQNMAAAREREEKKQRAQEETERQAREERRKLKPKKSVSFADLPPDHENQPWNSVPSTDWGDVAPARLNGGKSTLITRGQMDKLPMKMNVVERVPGLKGGLKSPPPPTSSHADSDDESDPGSPVPADSDDGEIIHSDHSDSESPPPPAHDGSEDSDVEHPDDDEPVEWDIEGYDFAQHQREIALAYYEKRAAMGTEALAAMRNHEHGEDEWDQPEVPLEANLASAPPKASASRFKASQSSGSSLPSHSLGSSILPSSQSSTLKSAVRLGKLEDGELAGGEEGESEDELDPQAREMLELLKQGEVVNVGPTLSTNGATASSSAAAISDPTSTSTTSHAPAPDPVTPVQQKPKLSRVSQFKMSLAPTPPQSPGSPGSSLSTPLTNIERSSPKLESRSGTPITVPTKTSCPPGSSGKALEQPRPPQMPGMIVDSPSFPMPGQSKASEKRPMQMPGMIVDSPSFPAPGVFPSPSFSDPGQSRSSSTQPASRLEVFESPSSLSPTSTVVGTPVSRIPSSATSAASAPPTPLTPVSASVLERRPPVVGTVREVTSAGPRSGGAAGREHRVSKFAAERM
ncbi:hypothetical protein BD413DRAFT_498876 [Trametes elegans]|nr:hypothetical protein BD413DRAFT_498876 [Trametes elegans]